MNRSRLYLWLQSALWTLLAALAAASAVGMLRAGGFTPQGVARRCGALAPLLLACLILTLAGWILGIRDERANRPAGRAESPETLRGLHAGRAMVPHRTALRRALLVASACLMAAGILNGSMRDVLYNAINICTECIGLG